MQEIQLSEKVKAMQAINEISKQLIEKQLNYEISDYDLNGKFTGLSVQAIIENRITILKTGEITEHGFASH